MSNPKEARTGDVVISTPKVTSLAELKPNPNNPREWNGTRMGRLKASLLRFGLRSSGLVVNVRTGHLVSGHMRLVALKALGVKEAPVDFVDRPAQEEMAESLTLNNTATQGRWSPKVKKQVSETRLALPDFYKELAVGEILDQLGGDQEPKGEDDGEEVKFKKGRAGKFVVKPCSQKTVELVGEKLEQIAMLNKYDGKGALAQALMRVFADLEPKDYGPGKNEVGG